MVLKTLLLFTLLIELYCEKGNDPRVVLKKMSATIGENVLICQQQTNFDQDIVNTFLSFWSDTTPLDDPNVGCVVMCVLTQLELLEPNGNIKNENAAAFLSAKGSDEFTTEVIIELYNMCKEIIWFNQECYIGIDLAKCFRAGMLMRNWAPDSLDPDADDENYDYTS